MKKLLVLFFIYGVTSFASISVQIDVTAETPELETHIYQQIIAELTKQDDIWIKQDSAWFTIQIKMLNIISNETTTGYAITTTITERSKYYWMDGLPLSPGTIDIIKSTLYKDPVFRSNNLYTCEKSQLNKTIERVTLEINHGYFEPIRQLRKN